MLCDHVPLCTTIHTHTQPVLKSAHWLMWDLVLCVFRFSILLILVLAHVIFFPVFLDFVVLGLVSSILSQQTKYEQNLLNYLICK